MNSALRRLIIAAGLAALTGCSWCPCFKDDKPASQFGVISVRLNELPPTGKTATYAYAAQHDKKKKPPAGFKRVDAVGAAAFVLPANRSYDVGIFYDLNKNQERDADEPCALAEALQPAVVTSDSPAPPVTLAFGVLGTVPTPAVLPVAPPPAPVQAKKLDSRIPAAALPYLDQLPLWLRQEIER